MTHLTVRPFRINVPEEALIDLCRRFLGSAAMTSAAARLGMTASADAQSSERNPVDATTMKPGTNTSFGPLKQIDAGVLNGADAPRRHIQAYERHTS